MTVEKPLKKEANSDRMNKSKHLTLENSHGHNANEPSKTILHPSFILSIFTDRIFFLSPVEQERTKVDSSKEESLVLSFFM